MNPNYTRSNLKKAFSANRRLAIWHGVLLFIIFICIARLFYLQIIRHDHYRHLAQSSQLKQYSIAPERGIIKAYEAGKPVPIVLNQKLYTLYGDPKFIKNSADVSMKMAAITGGNATDYKKLLETKDLRYVILAKRLSEDQANKVKALKLPGIGIQALDYRTYPQGSLSAQVLGFVNDEGVGKYGLEQALNQELSGTPGELKAITDASGVPLAASKENIQVDPINGSDVVMTIDLGMQKQLETLLKAGLDRAKSTSGSALIMDVNTGAVKAMANFPTFDPSHYFNATDSAVFTNPAVSAPLELGSTMKTLTTAAGLDQGVIRTDTTYSDPAHWSLDGHEITNIEEDGGAGTRSVAQILDLSINTGATWILMQMGGKTGEVNQTARDKWHDYMVNHFQLGKTTGIEQGYEAAGYIPDPDKGYALQLTYANTAFGQAMTATITQLAAAVASVVNGGTYYQPRLVDQIIDANGIANKKDPVVIKRGVVSAQTSQEMINLMEYVVSNHYKTGFNYLKFPDNYIVGGKTGTAQIANPDGGYYDNKYNGTYVGFVGGDKPQYVISVRVNEPGLGGYAGSQAAQPLFSDLAHMLINDFNVTPKS